jgi:hypothetical protein
MSDTDSRFARLYDKALGAYLGLAIGDALGATVEFMRPREIQAQYGVHRDIVGGGWLRLARGQVTDDTTMSLALGDALLLGGEGALRGLAAGDTALTEGIAQAYVRWWRGKPVDCGHTCRRGILRYVNEGTLAGPPNEGDGGNGALMRNLPAALATLGDDALFEQLSLAQARITHHHPLSDAATLGLGQLLRALLQRGPGPAGPLGRGLGAGPAGLPLHALPRPRHRLCGGHGADRAAPSDPAPLLRGRAGGHRQPGRRRRHHRRPGRHAGRGPLRRQRPAAALAAAAAARHRAGHHRPDQRPAGPVPALAEVPMPDITSADEALRVQRTALAAAYHERSKHRLERYANGPETLDWDAQPDPFRRYRGPRCSPCPCSPRTRPRPGTRCTSPAPWRPSPSAWPAWARCSS